MHVPLREAWASTAAQLSTYNMLHCMHFGAHTGAHTVCFLQMFTTQQHLVILMEHVNGISLSTLLANMGPLNEEEARFAFRQIIDAVSFCHSKVGN